MVRVPQLRRAKRAPRKRSATAAPPLRASPARAMAAPIHYIYSHLHDAIRGELDRLEAAAGMAAMSEEFKRRGAEVYHVPGALPTVE